MAAVEAGPLNIYMAMNHEHDWRRDAPPSSFYPILNAIPRGGNGTTASAFTGIPHERGNHQPGESGEKITSSTCGTVASRSNTHGTHDDMTAEYPLANGVRTSKSLVSCETSWPSLVRCSKTCSLAVSSPVLSSCGTVRGEFT